jgi:hypothetical protein
MNRNSPISARWQVVLLAIVLVSGGLPEQARCEPDGPILLLQQSPPQSGRTTPEAGVHRFGMNTTVTVSAVANPGYQFVLWIGEVSDPTANSTTVYLNAPKIVIAVFERSEYAFAGSDKSTLSLPGAGGGSFPSSGDYSSQGGGLSGGGSRRREAEPTPQPVPEPEASDYFSVPESIPEPATGALLLLGGLLTFLRRPERSPLRNANAPEAPMRESVEEVGLRLE